jgi:hypothetical protein
MVKGIVAYLRRHHLALLALFLALGGTSIAATNVLLPKNSVGTVQLRDRAITKQKIAKKTITALKGNRGLRGTRGGRGPTGTQGQKGDAGAAGPSASFLSTQTADFSIPEPGGGVSAPIVSLTLSAGTYVIQVTGSVTRIGLSAGQGATHTFQLRRDGGFLNDAKTQVTTVQGSTGTALANFELTRLVNITGSQTMTWVGFDTTSAGTSSTVQNVAMTATLAGSGIGGL